MTTEIEIAKQIYDLAKEQGWIDQLLSFIKKRHKVLVLGSSGVGKKNFLKSLQSIHLAVSKYEVDITNIKSVNCLFPKMAKMLKI